LRLAHALSGFRLEGFAGRRPDPGPAMVAGSAAEAGKPGFRESRLLFALRLNQREMISSAIKNPTAHIRAVACLRNTASRAALKSNNPTLLGPFLRPAQ
jgi:hypothetical protein